MYDTDHILCAADRECESDPHSCEATQAVANKAQKKSVFNGIRTHDLSDTGVMLYLLSYEASLEAGQV